MAGFRCLFLPSTYDSQHFAGLRSLLKERAPQHPVIACVSTLLICASLRSLYALMSTARSFGRCVATRCVTVAVPVVSEEQTWGKPEAHAQHVQHKALFPSQSEEGTGKGKSDSFASVSTDVPSTPAGASCHDSFGFVLPSSFTWTGSALGQHILLGQDLRTIHRRKNHLLGGTLVIAPVSGRSFRFRVLKTEKNVIGGTELGFTAVNPTELLGGLPKTASALPRSWVVDSIGCLYVAGSYSGVDAPEDMQQNWMVEDVVKCTATDGGNLRIEVNGEFAADVASDLPSHCQLFPVLNMCGMQSIIELLDD